MNSRGNSLGVYISPPGVVLTLKNFHNESNLIYEMFVGRLGRPRGVAKGGGLYCVQCPT